MKRLTATGLLVVPIVLVLGCTQGEKTITLVYKYETGLNLIYEQTAKRHGTVHIGDSLLREEKTLYHVSIDQLVKSVGADQVAEIVEYSQWHYDMSNVRDSTVRDSASWEHKFIYRGLPNGKTLDIRFGEDWDSSSISYTRSYVEQAMPVFPPSEHSPGYSWTQSTRVVFPEETMEASTTYRIKSLAREAGYDCAVIEYFGTLILPMQASQKDTTFRGGLDRISSNGVFYFAYREGFIVLQRDHSVNDGYRDRLDKTGKLVRRKIATETDTDFVLKKRTIKK